MIFSEEDINLKDLEGRIFDRLRLFLALPDLTRKIIYDISRDLIQFLNNSGERRLVYGPMNQCEKVMMIQGRQIVDWMVEKKVSKTRQNSAYIAQWLVNAGELQGEEGPNSMELFDSTTYYFLPLMESIMFLRQNVIQASVLQQHIIPTTVLSAKDTTISAVRYAVLTRHHRLYFYDNDQAVIPVEVLNLDPDVTRLQLVSPVEDKHIGSFSFMIDSLETKREHIFTCRHEQDRKLWVDKLQSRNLVFRETLDMNIRDVRSFYELWDRMPNGKLQPMKEYENKLSLVVNLPYSCNDKNDRETFKRLSLLQKAHDADLVVLGFPSFDIEEKIAGEKNALLEDVGITSPPEITVPTESYKDVYTFSKEQLCDFPIFEVEKVRGPSARPVYQYIASWMKKNTLESVEVDTHYVKYLIDYKGNPIKRYDMKVQPVAIQDDIERLVAQETGKP